MCHVCKTGKHPETPASTHRRKCCNKILLLQYILMVPCARILLVPGTGCLVSAPVTIYVLPLLPIKISLPCKSRPQATPGVTCVSTMTRMLALLSLLLSFTLVSGVFSASLVVNTTSGTFRGTTVSGLDRWLGVPFAQPPVGSLRFKAPVPVTNAEQVVKNATSFGSACPQLPSSSLGAPMSEDCLFLNVGGALSIVRES